MRRAYERVPLFRQRMEERDARRRRRARPLATSGALPFTVKSDLRDTYPFGLFASPMEEVVRLHASSGTTGKPIVVAYTQDDVAVWSQRHGPLLRRLRPARPATWCRTPTATASSPAAWGPTTAPRRWGPPSSPSPAATPSASSWCWRTSGSPPSAARPSYMVHLIERAKEAGIGFGKLKVGVFGAEPWSEEMRQHIQAEAGIRAHDIYGLSEIIGPGVGIECDQPRRPAPLRGPLLPGDHRPGHRRGAARRERGGAGAHHALQAGHADDPLPDPGHHRHRPTPCACGRTIRRIRRIGRRSDDMFIIRGINVFPSQVEAALLEVEGTLPHYQIVLTREKGLDEMEVQVEVTAEHLLRPDQRPGGAAGAAGRRHRAHRRPAREGPPGRSPRPSPAARARPSGSLDQRKI